ncbi:uncharacterized protein LOC119083915 [Bradysia coprophila]|uniref:uncharacterized protein LOC119083915 n=1 Tax=Bradysia coprophila TaxID=38358 RepID=UPI00187DD41E|nr:uncharacterized protein LOC119083915 [Bradysia coprophila]
MDKLKKLRAPIRAAFTKTANAIEEILKEKEINIDQLQALGDVLDKKAESLVQLDQKIMDTMVEEDLPEEQINEEYEKSSEYEEKMCFYRRRIESLMQRLKPIASDTNSDVFGTVVSRQKTEKKYKLPKIEFTKFKGDLKEWLAFWAQFQKIHKDEEMADEDKFHYLRQSTEESSKAREVVDSFPMTAENYPKVVKHLKERFGNKDMLIEYYVRELLRLVLSNALNQSKKMSISSLYDKLETQLRALESLNVTRDEFVAILYPLVESCLPEDILRAWERHRFLPLNREETDRLSRLMLFVKSEVESEERISMARGGFGDQSKKVPKKEDKYEIPSAAGLIVGSSDERKREVCIFCGGKSHFSRKCWKGAKMSLAEKQKTCKEGKVCFSCLNRGHITPNCPNKDRLKCETCEGQHCHMMCPDNTRKVTEKTNVGLSQSKELVQASPTSNLLLKERKEESVLSTLLIRIHNGSRSIVVRAAIDSGSHKTYLLKRVIKELGLEKLGQETLIHELFGGHQLKETVHGRYRILAENLDGSYACKFDVLEQERICFDVKRIVQGNWLQKLQEENIILTDVGVGSAEIELLIGNNVAGRLLHKIHRLKEYENFVAMDYSLGWTIMGTVPTNTSNDHTDTALLVHTLFIREANVADLWRLDLIGIEDAAETKKKETNLRTITEQFQKNLKINDEGRYEISLPFINGSPPLKSNRKMAEQRLITMSRKLSPELKEAYCKVFEDWEMSGVIEQVPEDQLENGAYYMPHKPVLNPSSLTTPVRPVFDASAKEKGSLSLNDSLEKGPNLLEVITSIMIRFRLWRHGLISDIKKAFLQISIQPKDRDFLRFLWWEKKSNKIKVFRHRRLVFGLTCSSFTLAAIINKILDEATKQYEETAKQLKDSNYVDNCITSVETEEEVFKFEHEATYLLSTGQFELRGWEWNAPTYHGGVTKEISVLGLTWNFGLDTLSCDIDKGSDLGDQEVTKQIILSTTHKIFDPIGFTTPLVVYPKVLLQECWKTEIGWKDPVPELIAQKFRKWCKQLAKVKEITIPRWIGLSKANVNSIQLHVPNSV